MDSMDSIDVSNDREIERLGANATAQHALSFWNQLAAAARKDALELDPLWGQQDAVIVIPNDAKSQSFCNNSARHTKTLVLTDSLSFDQETRFYARFRSNFSPESTFPVFILSSSFLYGDYTRPKWTLLLQATQGQLMDYNFITLLRTNAHDMFWMTETEAMEHHGSDSIDQLLVVSRAQWLFIELARCREGCYGYTFRRKLEIFDLKTGADELETCIQQLMVLEEAADSRHSLLNKCWTALDLLQTQWPNPNKQALVESGAGKILNWAVHHLPHSLNQLKQGIDETLQRWRHLIQLGSILHQQVRDPTVFKCVNDHFKVLNSHTYWISSQGGQSSFPSLAYSPRTSCTLSDLIVHSKDTTRLRTTFQSLGLVVLDPVDRIPDSMIQECRSYSSTCLELFQQTFLSPQGLHVRGDNEFDFHECRQRPGHRVDNRYKILDPSSPILALLGSSTIHSLIQNLYGSGMEYKVLYAGIVHSFPSLENQPPPPAQLWHRDGPSLFSSHDHHPTHCMNIFIPLVDVDSINGCTEFLPGSHCDAIFENHCSEVIQLAEKDPSAQHSLVARPQVKAGTIIAFDIRVMHRGLANLSNEERPLLYFTVARSWWEEKHMFKETNPERNISCNISESEITLDQKMVSIMYKLVTGLDDDDVNMDQDYGHPHYTDRFDLLLLEDLKSFNVDNRLRGKANLTAVVSFATGTDESKHQLMVKWVEILGNTHSQRIAAIEHNSSLRKKVASQDFTSIADDLNDVTTLYHVLVSCIFSEPLFDALGFTRSTEGIYIMLALFKAQCSQWSREGKVPFVPDLSVTRVTHEILEESVTSWWHAGNGRFSFKGQPENYRGKGKLLIVFSSLGSGLARPEWGGSLAGVAPIEGSLDVLNVLDPAFSWYQQDPSCTWKGQEFYRNRLKDLTSSYDEVMYLGDSMGAAAALLFADLADQVLVFTPQIDISTYDAIKRMDFPSHLRSSFKDAVIDAVNKSKCHIKIHYGSGCNEDVSQIGCLIEKVGEKSRVTLVPHDFDDHVLSIHLKDKGELKSIIHEEVKAFQIRNM